MKNEYVARVSVFIHAPAPLVWDALVNPKKLKQYMMGSEVASDWTEGSEITWSGEWQGKPYRDKGLALRAEPNKLLQYTHFSPLSGGADSPENYRTVTVELADQGKMTLLALSQDNNAGEKEKAESEKNWRAMLEGMRKLLEKRPEPIGRD